MANSIAGAKVKRQPAFRVNKPVIFPTQLFSRAGKETRAKPPDFLAPSLARPSLA